MGVPQARWIVYKGKSIYKWMKTGGTRMDWKYEKWGGICIYIYDIYIERELLAVYRMLWKMLHL